MYGMVHIYDPVAGGAALVVIKVGWVRWAVFKEPAYQVQPSLACGGRAGFDHLRPGRGREALLVLKWALA